MYTVIDDLGRDGSVPVRMKGYHWKQGFLLARFFREADCVLQTCCFRTHRFGGHFTMSLKNSAGMTAKTDSSDGYDRMAGLHSSPRQRSMIAEINTAATADLIILDERRGFATGGPDAGAGSSPGVICAGSDRVALDTAGVALLRRSGTTPDVS